MSEGQRSTLLAYLRRLVGAAASDSSDAELLERFAAQHDEAAFEALLTRHGPLVWNVCRRVLSEEHAAEDAFQATFLVLVRKAQSVSKQASIRSWLHGVALRVALRTRQQEQLRYRREQEMPIRSPEESSWLDMQPILDEEIQRLPEKYRLPIILCYLEGQTNDEAAQLLNCPRGTIATRLARARERLRSRLLRRGVTLSAGTLAALLSDNAMSAIVPPALLAQAARVGLTGAASVSITTLTEGVSHAMFLSKVKMATVFVLLLAVIAGTGAGAYYLHAQVRLPKSEGASKRPESKEEEKTAKKSEPAKDAKTEDEKTALLKRQVALAEKVCLGAIENLGRTRRFGNTLNLVINKPEEIYIWSVRWLQGQLALNPKHEDQIAALEAHLKRMTKLREAFEQLSRDLVPHIRVDEAEWYRVEAQLWLMNAKAKQAKAK